MLEPIEHIRFGLIFSAEMSRKLCALVYVLTPMFTLYSPVCEHVTVEEVGLRQGMHVIVEPGPAPTSNQITVHVTHHHAATKWDDLELIVERDLKIGDFQKLILDKAGLEGNFYTFL